MNTRILLAGLLGGVAMFIWSSIAHMVLPLGEVGVQEIPNEADVTASLKSALGQKGGLFLFPGPGLGPNPTSAEKREAMGRMAEKFNTQASGLLSYHPPGAPLNMGKLLGVEFLTETIEAILAFWLLSQTRLVGYGKRVGFVFVVGIIAAIATNISYWNWYSFPADYTATYIFNQMIGFLCAALVGVLVLKKDAVPELSRT